MDEINKNWLTNNQQKVLDDFTLGFENNSFVAEDFWISLVCDEILGRMFLFPEEIEEVMMMNRPSLAIEKLRKLKSFRDFLAENSIRSPYSQTCIDDLYETYFSLRKELVLWEFFNSVENDWKHNIERFMLLFELIEHDYEKIFWESLSFKGLEIKVWYDEWLWM